MHSAPAVSYPVGRSQFEGWLMGLTAFVGVLATLLWAYAVDAFGWRQWVFAVTLVGVCSFAGAVWRRFPGGTLRWDGQTWGWLTANASISGTLTVHLDWQLFMIVSLRTDFGDRVWLWPERSSEAARWNALRRAVFSRDGVASAQGVNSGDEWAQEKS